MASSLKMRMGWRALVCVSVACLASACVERECTQEERLEAGAQDDDECRRIVPLRTFTADRSDAVQRERSLQAGQDLRIEGDVRGIEIVEGESEDRLVVTFLPQVELADGRSQEVAEATMQELETSVSRSGNTVVLRADRGESRARLGAKLTVELPSEFNGKLSIEKFAGRTGDVEIDYLASARELDIDIESLGDLELSHTGDLRRVLINTEGDVETAPFASPNLEIVYIYSEFGDISTGFARSPSDHVWLQADFGDIRVDVPGDDDFILLAEGDSGVQLVDVVDDCEADNSKPNRKSLICNDGDPEGITFNVRADGSVRVRTR